MKQVLCVWFPNWPLQRACHGQSELKQQPVVLYGDSPRGGWQVVARSRQAAVKGVMPGMPLAEAKGILQESRDEGRVTRDEGRGARGKSRGTRDEGRAARGKRQGARGREGDACFIRYNPQADLAALRRLAGDCRCFSPCAGIEESESPECLLFDITGCEHLFGGADALAKQLAQQLDQQSYVARLAIANTVGAAWALARYQDSEDLNRRKQSEQRERAATCSVTSVSSCSQAISSLPIAALRLSSPTLQTLHELDIRRIGQLQALPRETLASRFGAEVARRLDQATGEIEELITPVRLPEPIEATCSFEEPVASRDALQVVVRQLLDKITRQLESSQQGVRSLLVHLGNSSFNRKPEACVSLSRAALGAAHASGLRLNEDNGQGISFTVSLVQSRASADHLFELIAMKFERLTLTSPVSNVLLRATTTTRLPRRQHSLLGEQQAQQNKQLLAALLERLSSRLGEKAVAQPELYPDAQPEYAFRLRAVVKSRETRDEGRGARDKSRKGVVEGRETRDKSREEKQHGASVCSSPALDSRLSTLVLSPSTLPPRPSSLVSPSSILAVSVIPDGPPVRFSWSGRDHRIARYWGPERIETGWWRERGARRDYYRVETDSGQQFWVYRCLLTKEWFLQGAFE